MLSMASVYEWVNIIYRAALHPHIASVYPIVALSVPVLAFRPLARVYFVGFVWGSVSPSHGAARHL